MSSQSIKPGRILENFKSLLEPEESPARPPDPEENTPTYVGLGGKSQFSKENPETKKLTYLPARPLGKFWRH